VPKGDREQSISLDVGSGNTKGGYKPAGGELVYVAIPLGTVTFTQRVAKEAKEKEISFVEAASRLREKELLAPLRKGAKGMPELAKRKQVYLSGGMVWAMTTMVKPAELNRAYVRFTAADVKAFLAMATKKPGAALVPDLTKVADADVKKQAEKEAATVN